MNYTAEWLDGYRRFWELRMKGLRNMCASCRKRIELQQT